MTEPHAAIAYPDLASEAKVAVLENVRVARDTYRLRIACPRIAQQILPGQFVMLRLSGGDDPLLGRPLAAYAVVRDAEGRARGLDLVYVTVGRMTRRLAAAPSGTPLRVWGPLGNGFPPEPAEHLLIVAGGIGVTPFLMLAREYLGLDAYGRPPRAVPRAKRVSMCYGARSVEDLAGLDDFRRAGVELHMATDDGSCGHKGFVTDLIEPVAGGASSMSGAADIPVCRLVACGPEAMLRATAQIARRLGLPCQVSLERPMACGIGACFSCVARVRDASGQWDYRRTCVEGPVFNSEDVEL